MRFITIFIVTFLKIIQVENKIVPINCETMSSNAPEAMIDQNDESSNEKVIGLDDRDDEYSYEGENKSILAKKPCAIVVLSNIQHPSVQSLLRKYRYDANGVLIPSSVKYFIKLPQGLRSSPILVQLNDKAFSPLGGFVRYYKEVPPIPQSW